MAIRMVGWSSVKFIFKLLEERIYKVFLVEILHVPQSVSKDVSTQRIRAPTASFLLHPLQALRNPFAILHTLGFSFSLSPSGQCSEEASYVCSSLVCYGNLMLYWRLTHASTEHIQNTASLWSLSAPPLPEMTVQVGASIWQKSG